jgi:hypothetical protein
VPSAADHALFNGLGNGVSLRLGQLAVCDSLVQPGFQGGRTAGMLFSAQFLQCRGDFGLVNAEGCREGFGQRSFHGVTVRLLSLRRPGGGLIGVPERLQRLGHLGFINTELCGELGRPRSASVPAAFVPVAGAVGLGVSRCAC